MTAITQVMKNRTRLWPNASRRVIRRHWKRSMIVTRLRCMRRLRIRLGARGSTRSCARRLCGMAYHHSEQSHNLAQVLFALNRVYFPSDKTLAAALDAVQHSPSRQPLQA